MEPQDAWLAAYHQLQLQLDRATFETWLRETTYLGYAGGVFSIGAANSYARDMLEYRLYRQVRRVLSDVFGLEIELQFSIHKPEPQEPVRRRRAIDPADLPLFRELEQSAEDSSEPLHRRVLRPERPALPQSVLNPRFTFERFVVSNGNRAVYEAARAVADYPGSSYNPLVIYGGVGLGKTHLLHAVAHACAARGLNVIYVPSEAFVNDLIDSIRQKTTAMFRERYRRVDVLLVDDIQFISGKESTQEEFFHTFNALYTYNKQIILASDRHPGELTLLEDRLRSRFTGGLLMDMQPCDLETRIAILRLWASERGITLPLQILQVIAERAPNNLRELEGAFNQVVAKAHYAGSSVTMQSTEDLLERYERPRQHYLQQTPAESCHPEQVVAAVAAHFGLQPHDLTGKDRRQRINEARQVAMWLCRELTSASLPQIGELFGGRSHTTVLHGCNKIGEDMDVDPALERTIRMIYDSLRGDC